MVSITLPYPPSANRYWRNYRGMTVKSDQARQYQEQAGWIAKSQGVQPLTGDIAVRIDVYRPAQRGDLDNSIKVLLDSLNGIAYQDDNQIVKIIAQRFNDKRNPRAEITISSCTEQGNPCLI